MRNEIPSEVIVSSIRAAKTNVLGTMLSSACALVMLTPALAQQALSQNVPIDIHDHLRGKSRKSCDTWNIAASQGWKSAIRRKQDRPVGTAFRSS